MAKLFQVTAILNNRVRYNPASTLYLNPKLVVDAPSCVYTNNSGATAIGTSIMYAGYDRTLQNEIIVSEPPSTVRSRQNAANTTDVHSVQLTVIDPSAPATGTIPNTLKSVHNVNVDDIYLAMAHPLNTSNSLVMVMTPVRDMAFPYRCVETAAAVASAANS